MSKNKNHKSKKNKKKTNSNKPRNKDKASAPATQSESVRKKKTAQPASESICTETQSTNKAAVPAVALDDLLTTPPANPDALHSWIERVLEVRIARTPLVDRHAAPFDYLCHTFFEGTQPARPTPEPASAASPSPDCIVWANRGGGKTFLGAIATLLDILFKPGVQIRILAGSLEQAARMYEHLRTLLEKDQLAPVSKRITARRISLPGMKSAVEILAASQTSVRGTRVQKLRCDEVDLFDPEVWSAAQLVTRSLKNRPGPWGDTIRGSVEALSTMHRPFGMMWKLVGEPTNTESPRSARSSQRNADANHAPIPSSASLRALSDLRGEVPLSSRPLFRWGLLDVLEHCTDEHSCNTCSLHDECQGRAKTLLTPATAGHITISDAVAMKSRVGRETWDSEMLCFRPSRSSTVYPEFDPRLHVFDDLRTSGLAPGAEPWYRFSNGCDLESSGQGDAPLSAYFSYCIGGMDFGARAESVVLLAGVTHTGVVCVLREHCRKEALVSQHIDALDRWHDEQLFSRGSDLSSFPPLKFLGIDPAGNARNEQTGDTNAKLLAARGYPVRSRGSEIPFGIRKVRERLAPAWPGPAHAGSSDLVACPRLLIHRSCTRLIECLTRYRYDPNTPESLLPEKDGHDHACDALRYMILNLDAPHITNVGEYI